MNPDDIRLGKLVTATIKHPCPECGKALFEKELAGRYVRRSCADHGIKEMEKIIEPSIYGC